MSAPSWTLSFLGIAAFVYTAQGLICTDDATPGASGNLLAKLVSMAGFTACSGVPAWFSLALTLIVTVPALLLLVYFIVNSVGQVSATGAVAILVIAVSTLALIGVSGLF